MTEAVNPFRTPFVKCYGKAQSITITKTHSPVAAHGWMFKTTPSLFYSVENPGTPFVGSWVCLCVGHPTTNMYRPTC